MHAYDTLHIVSDLHLGGASSNERSRPDGPVPVQAFGRGDRLAKWIRGTLGAPEDHRIGVVINGDFIDFLAENQGQYLDLYGPGRRLERVAKDPAFASVFDALRDFVADPRARLVIVLGNHDVELLLPETRHALLARLGWPSTERIEFALDGTGYHCTVGGRIVFCTHGNEHDAWNVVDQRAIRELLRRVHRGEAPRREDIAEATNAGTRLVVDVMNDIKQRHPFVDLLKPEVETVIPILSTFSNGDEGSRRLAAAWEIGRRRVADSRRVGRVLSSTRDRDIPAPVAGPAVIPDRWDTIEALYQRGVDPVGLAANEGDRTLGVTDAVIGTARAWLSKDGLREHLLGIMKSDRTFAAEESDEGFEALDREVDPRVDFIVAGHTHLARQIKRHNALGYYFNSGTWMRLLRLSPSLLASGAGWESVRPILEGTDLAAMERFFWKDAPEGTSNQDRRIFLDRCTEVRFSHDKGMRVVKAELLVVVDDENGGVRSVREPVFGPEPVVLHDLGASR